MWRRNARKKSKKKKNRKKKFKYWFDLRQDILFHGLTLNEAAEKYKISKQAISNHLKTHPRIKEAYYNRPWAEGQMRIKWLPPDCQEAREIIEDLHRVDSIILHAPEGPLYEAVEFHLEECENCWQFAKKLSSRAHVPFRLDCPSVEELSRTKKNNDIKLTQHLIVCHFCVEEYEALKTLPFDHVAYLAEKELDLFPLSRWRGFLRDKELDTIALYLPLYLSQGRVNYDELPSDRIVSYFRWRKFRDIIMDINLLGHYEIY
jgi:hypothetical protein